MTAGQLQKKSAAIAARWAHTRNIPVPQLPLVQSVWSLWLAPVFHYVLLKSFNNLPRFLIDSSDLRDGLTITETAACVERWLLPASFGPASTIVTKATSAATIFAWFGFIDLQEPTVDFLAIELLNRRIRFVLTGHFDESKASRTSRIAVFHYTRRLNRSSLTKQLLQILTGGL